jgi:glyoxylase-like metal-dependent hydrolase (beta-lactamase superfamily II)
MSREYAFGLESSITSYSANIAPTGTKAFILKLGFLEADSGFFLAGDNITTRADAESGTDPGRRTCKLQMYSVLIDHPSAGLILFEVGPGEDGWENEWGQSVCDVFYRVDADESQNLNKAIETAGYSINDVKHLIIGHLHIDHAGGLQYFKNRSDIQIWVHELEFKHAFWAVGTKADMGSYLPYYLDLNLQWNTFNDHRLDLFPGVTVQHSPGHTPGLIILQLNLKHDGTFIFTTDHVILRENYENGGHVLGWLQRDHVAWHNSTQNLRRLQTFTNATVVFGHDVDTVDQVLREKPFLH